ncbi:MAG: hypothetical protein ACTTKO_00775 [Candidatus Limimorpha sp.]
MKFKENAKTALFKVLSDLIQSDGIVNQGEIDYLKHVAHLVGITKSSMKKSETFSLSEATAILRNLGNMEKTAILRIIQQLSVSDDSLAPDESLLITALLLSIRICLPETDDINATLVSIPNLAFDTQNAVLYVEPDYDEKINVLIAKEHGAICKLLEKKERSFFFLPEVVRDMKHKMGTFSDIIQYIEPSLSEEQISVVNDRFKQFSSVALSKEIFLNYLNIKGFNISKPAFFFKIQNKRPSHFQDFLILEISGDPLQSLQRFYKLNDSILKLGTQHLNATEQSSLSRFMIPKNDHPKNGLQYNGFHKIIIDTILKYNSCRGTGRLFVSSDGHLFLTDRNNIEIKMPSLCRAMYILFLLHEEGIYLFELGDYKDELLKIYKQTSTYADEKLLVKSVENAVDFVGITLNSNLSRIKKAILSVLGDEAAQYLIRGAKADKKKIHLDRRLVIFEDKKSFR